MKKIFTFLFAATLLTTAYAQYDRKDEWDNNNKENGYGKEGKHEKDDGWFKGRYYFTPRERDMQIAQINREYAYKVQSLKNNYFMSWYQKKRQVEFLKDQRDRDLRMVNARFNDRRNKFNHHDRRGKKQW